MTLSTWRVGTHEECGDVWKYIDFRGKMNTFEAVMVCGYTRIHVLTSAEEILLDYYVMSAEIAIEQTPIDSYTKALCNARAGRNRTTTCWNYRLLTEIIDF